MYSKTIIIGNVGRDAEMQYTQNGTALAHFNVAVNKTSGSGENKRQTTTWYRVTVWREKAETAAQYIKKGMLIMCEGEISVNAYINKEGSAVASIELNAYQFQFLSRANDGAAKGEKTMERRPSDEAPSESMASEIPF